MSDYFTRMAERAKGKEAAIRPIIPPAFAPAPVTGGETSVVFPILKVIEKDVFAPAVPESEHRKPFIKAGNVSMNEPAADVAEPLEKTDQENESAPPAASFALSPAEPVAATAHVARLDIVSGKAGSRPEPMHLSKDHLTAGENEATGQTADAGFTIFEAASSFIRQSEPLEGEELLTGWKDERVVLTNRPSGVAGTARNISTSVPPPSSRSAETHQHERFPLKGTAGRSYVQEEIPPPATIKVSIGRIEIRAAAPQVANAESRRPPVPKLSLDDYLKKQPGRTG